MGQHNSTLRYWLGQRAAVIVDRPLGSRHPAFPDLIYPLNYGYIPNTGAEDREPIDAYVLGIDDPISSCIGKVIAIVVRHDDSEDKLVVAPAGRSFEQAEIERAIHFQERFFTTDLIVAESPTD